MKKLITIVLSLAMINAALPLGVLALENEVPSNCQIVFVDGIEISVCLDNKNNIVLESLNAENGAQMTVNKNGEADLIVETEGETEVAEVIFENLSNSDIEMSVVSENGDEILIDDLNEIQSDEYQGQIALLGAALTPLQWAVILGLGLIISYMSYKILQGVVYIALDTFLKIPENLKRVRNEEKFYLADVIENNVFISPIAISESAAIRTIKAKMDVYTFHESRAKYIATKVGANAIYDGNHRNGSVRGIYYNHYHASSFRTAHIFFGLPV